MIAVSNKVIKLILIGYILVLAHNIPITLTALTDGGCINGLVKVKINDGSTDADACVDPTNALMDTWDCDKYTTSALTTSSTTFTCVCSTGKTLSTRVLDSQTKKGCIPNTQFRVNCDKFARKSADQYTCKGCQNTASFIVSLGSTGNANGYPSACIVERVPGCKQYGLYTTSKMYNNAGTAYDQTVGCATCQTGFTSFSDVGTNKFAYWDKTSTSTYGTVGKACPVDGSIDLSCITLKLNNLAYECQTCSSSAGLQGTLATTFTGNTITVGCLKQDNGLAGASLVTYYNVDRYCTQYKWGESGAMDKFVCTRCKTGYTLYHIWDRTSANRYWRCHSGLPPANCKQVSLSQMKANDNSWEWLNCKECKEGYDQVNLGPLDANTPTPSDNYICPKKGRFVINPKCHYFKGRTGFDDYDAIFSLTCKAKVNKGCVDLTRKPPCQDPCTIGGGADTYGYVAENNQATPARICVNSGYVDNCKRYDIITAPSSTGDNGGNKCILCQTGFNLVNTSATLPSSTTKGKICITDAQIVPKCIVYNNADLSCAQCQDGLGFDFTSWTCRNALMVATNCTKAVTVGSERICIACSQGYIVKNDKCVPAVTHCAVLSDSGACSACVFPDRFQLINNMCVEKIPNCLTIDNSGNCTHCKPSFVLIDGKTCVGTSSNTCPEGQYVSNGQCVKGTIDNCQFYTNDGKCDFCKTDYSASTDGKNCQGIAKKVCPPNTDKFKYVINPSNPTGDCVAVDINCEDSRDDGHCIQCKEGEYAHSDGLCYKIIFLDNGEN